MIVNSASLFRDCNPAKLVVHCCLLFFCILFAFKLDGLVDFPYWTVFLPLFIWKILAIAGAIVGTAVYCRNPLPEGDQAGRAEFFSIVLLAFEHALLLVFEFMVCLKLTGNLQATWTIVFVPLISESVLALLVCIWCIRKRRSFAFEAIFSANVLQFVFVAIRLDGIVTWPWVIVFIPFWIVLCVGLIGVLYAIMLTILLIRSIDLLPEYRRQHVYSSIAYAFLVVPYIIFIILLSSRLDGNSRLRYVQICSPLYVSLICLMFMTFCSRGGNQWWFGIRKDFCTFLLEACPCLSEYGNVSFRFRTVSSEPNIIDTEEYVQPTASAKLQIRDTRPPVTLVSIENPD